MRLGLVAFGLGYGLFAVGMAVSYFVSQRRRRGR